MNALGYVDIDQGIHYWKNKVARNEKWKKHLWVFYVYKIWQILKRFSRQLIWSHISNFWGVKYKSAYYRKCAHFKNHLEILQEKPHLVWILITSVVIISDYSDGWDLLTCCEFSKKMRSVHSFSKIIAPPSPLCSRCNFKKSYTSLGCRNDHYYSQS